MSITPSVKPSTQPRPVTLTLDDFSGGLNADASGYPLALSDNQLSDILNFKYVLKGGKVKLKSREGLTSVITFGAKPSTTGVRDIYEFVNVNGVVRTVIVGNSKLYYVDTNSYTLIGDLSSTRGRMCRLTDKLVIADGGTLKYWDGTTFGEFVDSGVSLIDYSQESLSTGGGMYVGFVERSGLKVAVTQNWSVKSMLFSLAKYGSPTGSAYAKIYASDGTTVVATSAALDVSTLTTDYVNNSFVFSTPVALTSGSTYYFSVYYMGGDSSNYIKLGLKSGDPTGDYVYYTASWQTGYSATYIPLMAVYNTAPVATFAITKKSRVYCNNSSFPNRLYYSNNNDPNDWSTINGAGFITFDHHYKINGAFVYKDCIYVFADNPKAVYKLTGDSPSEYAVQSLIKDVTAISQDTIQDVGSDLNFQDDKGVISLRLIEVSGEIEKAIVSRSEVNETYVLSYSSQISGKTVKDNYYLLTTTGNYLIAFDQELRTWTRLQLELGTGVTPTAFGVIAGVTYVGASDGNLYYFDYTKATDNGVDFSLMANLPWLDLGYLFEKDARFVDSVMISANQETYDLEVYINNNNVTPIKTLPLVSQAMNGAYQSPYCNNLEEVNFNFKSIMFKLTNIASGTGPHWLDRIVLEANILSRY